MDPSSGKFIALSVGVSVITSGLIWLMIKNMERKPFPPDMEQNYNDERSSYESNPSGHFNDNHTGGKKLNKKVSKKRKHSKKEKTLRRK